MLAQKLQGYGRPIASFETFALTVTQALASRRADVFVSPAHGGLHVRAAAGQAWTQDLSQIYAVWLGAPALRDSLVLLAVASICDRATLEVGQWSPSLQQVLPVLRRREDVCESDAVFAPFARSLARAYVLDRCGSHTLVTSALREEIAGRAADLRRAASENLDKRLAEVSLDRQGDGVWLIGSDTLPASSILFSATFWRTAPLPDAPLYAIPADAETLVVFTGGIERVQNHALVTALEIMDTSPSPLTSEIVAIGDLGTWMDEDRPSREA